MVVGGGSVVVGGGSMVVGGTGVSGYPMGVMVNGDDGVVGFTIGVDVVGVVGLMMGILPEVASSWEVYFDDENIWFS